MDDALLARQIAALCHECEERPSNPGFSLCQQCYTQLSGFRSMCTFCRVFPANFGYTACQQCYERSLEISDTTSYEDLLAYGEQQGDVCCGSFDVNSLPILVADANEEACPICLEGIDRGDRYHTLPCGHAYHMDCIVPWIQKGNSKCPVCRDDIRGNDNKSEH